MAKGNKSKLTDKQRKFCSEYLIDCNATQAAIRAGYSESSARSVASQLLTNLNIQSAIQERQQALKESTEITQERILQEESCIAYSDFAGLFDGKATTIAPHEIPTAPTRL